MAVDLLVRSEQRPAYGSEAEAPPQSQAVVDQMPKCWRCNRTLAEYLARPWSLRCQRCNATNRNATG